MSERPRFIDPGDSEWEVLDDILVVCPRCEAAARLAVMAGPASAFADRRMTCASCGYAKTWPVDPPKRGIQWWTDGRDPYLGLRLLLRTACVGQTLWAYNEHHLDLIEAYVGAEQRQRSRARRGSQSVVQNLPKWIKLAKNREDVLSGCARLRDLLRTVGPEPTQTPDPAGHDERQANDSTNMDPA